MLGGLGVDFKIWGEATRGELSIVEHPMEPGRLVPAHLHHDEDELSYVLEGKFGVKIGEEIGEAGPGSYIFKPRGVAHTFWNPGPERARLIEIIAPAGFERFFEALGKLGAALAAGALELADFEAQRATLGQKYHLDFVPDWADDLKTRFNLKRLG